MYASWRGHKKIVELLVSKGAKINIKTIKGNTTIKPPDYLKGAVDKEIVEFLKSKGLKEN